jgi:long-chain acyl-CoA synthetase
VGYFKDDKSTAEVITPDGWYKTGDIGERAADGSIRIIDRKRDVFKLSTGEFVSPARYFICVVACTHLF